MGLISSSEFRRAREEARQRQVQGGLGLLARCGWRGAAFHQEVFRVGKRLPDDPISDEERAAYDAVNTHRPWMLTDPRRCTGSPTPAMVPLPVPSTGGKAVVVSRATRSRMGQGLMQSDLSTVGGAAITTAGGTVVLGQNGLPAATSAALRRPAALAPRGSGADSAGAARRLRTPRVMAAHGTQGRESPQGTVIGLHNGPTPILDAIITVDGAVVGDGTAVGLSYVDAPASLTAEVRARSAVFSDLRDGKWYAMRRVTSGSVSLMQAGVVLRHQTDTVDEEVLRSGNLTPEATDLDDVATWPVITTLHLTVTEASPSDSWTIQRVHYV